MAPKKTLVIADDHALILRGMAELVGAEGIFTVVAHAATGPDALAALRAHRPDVAVLDIHMPGLNGIEAAREAAREGILTAVVFQTMHNEEEVFHAALHAGARGYVLKENGEAELLTCLRAVARGQSFFSPSVSNYLLNRAAPGAARAGKAGLESLTPNQLRILRMIASDMTTKEIAEALGVSPRTVDNHRTNMSERLGLRGAHSLLKFAYDMRAKLP